MIVAAILLGLVLALRFGPDTPLLRLLRSILVERPVRWIDRLDRRSVLFALVLIPLMLGGGELLILFGPEFLFVTATNVALYLDAMAVSALLAATSNLRAVGRRVRMIPRRALFAIVPLRRATPRSVRRSRTTSARSPANDDTGGWRAVA